MKGILKIVAIVVAVIVVILIAIPFFVNVNSFRPTIESDLTSALGRQVTVGNLSLSIFSGSVGADDISIADDPAYSKTAFVHAKSFKVGVELMPLIFSKRLNVTELTLNEPEINLVKSENGQTWNFSSLGGKNPSAPQPANKSAAPSGNPNLSVEKLNVKNGRLTVSQVGTSKSHVYDKVDITVTHFAFDSSFPFTMSADLPAGGSLNLDGKAGPISSENAARTPLEAKVTVKDMNLAQSGFIDPASGIAGIADFDGTVSSDGHQAKTEGTLTATKLQAAAKGAPAGNPVKVDYQAVYDLAKQSGEIPQCNIAMGKAIAHVTGSYDAHGSVTSIKMKLLGQNMPVDDLETMLPAVGVILPPKASLKGGDLNLDLTIDGPVDKLVITGPVRMENTQLANFDLGSKLSAVSALNGKKTGNDTTIQNFSSDVRVAPEGTQANNINLNVPAIGVVTGGGTVSPSNELAFKMSAATAGLTVPFAVEGTTSDPKFIPDVKGMATGMLKNALGGKGKTNPGGILGGFLKNK